MREKLLRIAGELMRIPTAPFREERIGGYIRRFCRERGMAVRGDGMGNLVVTYGGEYRNTVFAFGAHTDHPGFIIEKDSQRGRTTALFYGHVEEEYFKGEKVRVFSDEGEVVGRITRTQFDQKRQVPRVNLVLEGAVRRGDTGMWDVRPFRVRGDRLYARVCDDLAGAAAVLALLDELKRRRVRKKVMGVFTVAEEAGFQGAKFLCQNRSLAKKVNLIAIEASSERPDAKIGDGVVIRVGDKFSVFTPGVTRFMMAVADRVGQRDKEFREQRKLMDGGTCESTLYQRFGYTNGAVCIPLGNYHNRNFKQKKIAAEYVSINDMENMVKLFLGIVKHSEMLEKFLKPERPVYKERKRALGERLWT